MFDANTRAYTVTMTVYAAENANLTSVKEVIADLSWVGGCRDPHDPAFAGLVSVGVVITRAKHLDR